MSGDFPILFSLHRTLVARRCGLCGGEVPDISARRAGGRNAAEYWRLKGGPRGTPRVLCCLCMGLFGPWTEIERWDAPTDGIGTIAALSPVGRLPG